MQNGGPAGRTKSMELECLRGATWQIAPSNHQQQINPHGINAAQFIAMVHEQSFVIDHRIGLHKVHMAVGHFQVLQWRTVYRKLRAH